MYEGAVDNRTGGNFAGALRCSFVVSHLELWGSGSINRSRGIGKGFFVDPQVDSWYEVDLNVDFVVFLFFVASFAYFGSVQFGRIS